ncbi:DoxX family protein [Dyella jejuensis]|uniref:DoxX family protein n=1 Tax=Dyella jejuensis TaxID=1432009 RepID=A0ABW8JMY0_9GAMM
MRILPDGRVTFALAMLALGLLCLFSGDFASVWQPVPADMPGRTYLACGSGTLMALAGAGLLFRRTLATAACVLTAYTLVWLLVLQAPRVIAAPGQEASWGACAEIAILVAASWMLHASAVTPPDKPYCAALTGSKALRMAQLLFAAALPLLGLEHLIYAQPTAAMVPAWLPDRIDWAYLTGMAHIAAGLAIGVAVLPRLAAALEAWMMGTFTVLVWIPSVVAAPMQRFAWTGLLISAALTAAAWIVAESYREASWQPVSSPLGTSTD